MKLTLTLFAAVMATPAFAHGAHVEQVGGHDHIAAMVAIGVAGFAAILGFLRSRAA